MDLHAIILDVLQADTSRALKFDDVVQEVANRLEHDIRTALNELTDNEQILRHVGGHDHPWRYQGKPFKRRAIE